MPLVKVKEKYQVTLPASVRRKAGLVVGDFLEANIEGKKITLTPKTVVDREIAFALEDVRKGRVYGPYSSAKEAIQSLHQEAKKLQKSSR